MIGILGGVGPAAGILFHQTILQHTESQGLDQGHLNVAHFSRSADITPRMEFLSQHKYGCVTVENPAAGMARTFEMMKITAQAANVPLVAGIPCITFHAEPIFTEFRRLATLSVDGQCSDRDDVKCLHLLQETVQFLSEIAPKCRNVGVMCTNGTRESRLFRDLLEPLGYTVLEVDDETQRELQETISNPEWGIKSNAPIIQPKCMKNFHGYARQLIEAGAEVLVLGCTEIPFAFGGAAVFDGVPVLDPMVALARALIREVDPSRLKPLNPNVRHP